MPLWQDVLKCALSPMVLFSHGIFRKPFPVLCALGAPFLATPASGSRPHVYVGSACLCGRRFQLVRALWLPPSSSFQCVPTPGGSTWGRGASGVAHCQRPPCLMMPLERGRGCREQTCAPQNIFRLVLYSGLRTAFIFFFWCAFFERSQWQWPRDGPALFHLRCSPAHPGAPLVRPGAVWFQRLLWSAGWGSEGETCGLRSISLAP